MRIVGGFVYAGWNKGAKLRIRQHGGLHMRVHIEGGYMYVCLLAGWSRVPFTRI